MDWLEPLATIIVALGTVAVAMITTATHRKTGRIEVAVNGASHAAAAELARVHGQLAELRKELSAVQERRVDEAQEAASLS